MSENLERGSQLRPALTRLTGLDAADFAREHWGERPLLTRHPDGFDDLFSATAADDLIAEHALRTPFVRMASEGTVLATSAFTGSGGFGAEIGDQVDSAKVLAEFAAGATLVLQGLHRTWAPIAEFTRALVDDLGHPAQVNAYITPASSRGFDPHYDTHDVFVIQIAGAKHWTIHEPVHRHPLADQPWTDHREAIAARAAQTPAIDAVFEPGDVLYLPRGWVHSAVAQGGTSIHLTIGVRAATRHDLLTRLLAAAGENPELRRPLPLGIDYADAASLAPELSATVAAAGGLLDQASREGGVARAMRQAFERAVRPAPVRPLATVDLLDSLDPATPIRWRSALRARIEHDETSVRIMLTDKTITLPAEATDAVRALHYADVQRADLHGADLQGADLQGADLPGADLLAGALPGLDADSSLVVARRLLREGVVVAREPRARAAGTSSSR